MALSKIPSAGFQDNVKFRNILINGDQSIAQRSTSTSSANTQAYHCTDRWFNVGMSIGTWTISQSTEVPTGQGFAKSLKYDCTTAEASPSAGDQLHLSQRIEGQNLQYLLKGTSSAKSLTLSFWVKTNKTGTYQVNLRDKDNTRIIGKTYAVSSADTWEKKILTFDGDTTGAFDNDGGNSLECEWFLGAGSNFTSGAVPTSWEAESSGDRAAGLTVNLGDSTSNEWYITGVQLEAGTTASDFETLPTDINLMRCKRYFQTKGTSLSPNAFTNNQTVAMGLARTVSQAQCYMELNPIMRSEPTVSGIGTLSNLKCHTATGGNVNTSSIGSDGTPNRQQVTYLANNLTSGLNNNEPIRLYGDYTITFDAEL